MVVNLCAAHKKTDSCAAHEVILTCFLQSCSTRTWISCSAQNRAHMLYTKDNSCVTREFGLSHLTKIEEHTCVAAHECQLKRELYRNYFMLDHFHHVLIQFPNYNVFNILCLKKLTYTFLRL